MSWLFFSILYKKINLNLDTPRNTCHMMVFMNFFKKKYLEWNKLIYY